MEREGIGKRGDSGLDEKRGKVRRKGGREKW